MSSRNIRKLLGGIQLPPPDSSDEEYVPSCTRKHKTNLYAGLEVSDSESKNAVSEESTSSEAEAGDIKKKSKKRIKKKQRKSLKTLDVDLKTFNKLDEIDRSVLEINAQYGEPPPREQPPEEPKANLSQIQKRLFSVRQYYLDDDKEMDRRFGRDPDAEPIKKKGRQPNLRIINQKCKLIKTEKKYKENGLSMKVQCEKDGLTFFTFCHDKEYQKMHKMFLVGQIAENQVVFPFPDSEKRLHVEGMIEVADRYYMSDSYAEANAVIRTMISFMEQSSHLKFNVTKMTVRLEYKYLENRAFHIALLKYAYLLTNRACHRTALEICKILLNLDPSDPLAVLMIIDIIAIRGSQHEWIVEAIEYWNEARDAKLLFNFQYSYALARFHILRKKKDGFEEADDLLKSAMKMFPAVVTYIFRHADMKNKKEILDSPLFNPQINKSTANLNDLMLLYTKHNWHKFTEEPTRTWLTRNVTELAKQYAENESIKIEVENNANIRKNLFQVFPVEMMRHLSLIQPLAMFLNDEELPVNIPNTMPFDPFPPEDGINIYQNFNPAAVLIENLRGDPYFQELHDGPWVRIPGLNQFNVHVDDDSDYSDFDVEEDDVDEEALIFNELLLMHDDPFFSNVYIVPATDHSEDEYEYGDYNVERVGTDPESDDSETSQELDSDDDENTHVSCDDSEEEVPRVILPERSTPFSKPRNNLNEMKDLCVSVAKDMNVSAELQDRQTLPDVCKDSEIESETGPGTSCENVTKSVVDTGTKTGKGTNDVTAGNIDILFDVTLKALTGLSKKPGQYQAQTVEESPAPDNSPQ